MKKKNKKKKTQNKQHTVPTVCPNRKPYRTQTLFQFSESPSSILGTTENATFAHFIVVRLSSLVLSSECSYTLILPFTSKTGQSVAQNRQNIFLILVFLVKRGHILSFYRPNFRLQTNRVLEIELNEQECLHLFIDFYLGIPITDSRHRRFSL